MNIYEFVNSNIREYWEKIGYKPSSPLEMAWLIWQSKNHEIEGKHAAWNWLINNMPDCEVNGKWIEFPQRSLHKFLSRYMEIEDFLILRFFIPEEGAVYTYRALWENDGSEWCKSNSIFSTFEDAFADATEDNELAPLFLEFEKKHLGAHGRSIRVRMTPDKQPVFLDEEFMLNSKEESALFYDIFFNLKFDFPTPFKKGDIIHTAKAKYKDPRAWDATFVIGETD